MIRSYDFGAVATRKSLSNLLVTGACALTLLGCNDKLVPTEDAMDGGGSSNTTTVRASVESLDASTKEIVIQGGRLYDNWFDVTAVGAPTVNNPLAAYIEGSATPADTNTPYYEFVNLDKDKQYRCKTCHGFTFNGEYGFVGVMDAADNKSIAEIEAIIRDGITYTIGDVETTVHDFGDLLPAEVTALANFVKYGVVNIDDYIYAFTPAGKGDAVNGKTLYTTSAAKCGTGGCHASDGRNLDFDDSDTAVEYVGTIGQEDPAEMLHKIRFGDPMESRLNSMPSIYDVGLTTQDAADIMAYTQQLPCNDTDIVCP